MRLQSEKDPPKIPILLGLQHLPGKWRKTEEEKTEHIDSKSQVQITVVLAPLTQINHRNLHGLLREDIVLSNLI